MSKYVPRGKIMHRNQPPQSQKFFEQLIAYTQEVAARLKIAWDAKGRRNYTTWDEGYPTGYGTHFTASNSAVSQRKPLGRIPVLFRRFARRSGSPGVHFIVWDCLVPQFADLRAKYPMFEHLKCDVWCWGLDVAFYHGNALNGFATGTEHRNLGRLTKRSDGTWGWGRKGVNSYVGREPVKIRDMGYYEPFTRAQIEAEITIARWQKDLYGMEPMKFLGHLHVTSNRTDPFPHFPLQLVRDAVFFDDRPLDQMDWLLSFVDDPDFWKRNDDYIEDLLDTDLDDNQDCEVDVLDLWARKGAKAVQVEDAIYGSDDKVTDGDVVEAKKALYHLGYYPFAWGPVFTAGSTPEFQWALKMFQNRWVKAQGKKVIHLLPATGTLTDETVDYMNKMLAQYDLLPEQ